MAVLKQMLASPGTNLVDASETADCIAEDVQHGILPGRLGSGISEELARHKVQVGSLTSVCLCEGPWHWQGKFRTCKSNAAGIWSL